MDASQIGDAFRDAIRIISSMCPPGDFVVFLEDDQSRFDMHMLEGPCAIMMALYLAVLPKWVAEILRRGTQRGRTLNRHIYTVWLTMLSGMTDTAIFDTIVNWFMKMWIHGRGRPWISLIIGDDSATVTLYSEMVRLGLEKGLVERYQRLGMDVEAMIKWHALDVGLCSGRMYPCGSSYVLMPKIGSYLIRSVVCMKDFGPRARKEWLRSAAASLEVFGNVDPLCAALGRSVRRWSGFGKERSDQPNTDEYRYKPSVTARSKPEQVAAYYDHHYGFSAADVQNLVDTLSSLVEGGTLNHPLLNHMVEVDLAGEGSVN